jgi:hypothetical protein
LQEAGEVHFVDITRRMVGRGIGPLLAYYSEDPLHMNREGYQVLGCSLAEYLGAVERKGGDLRVRRAAARPAWMDQESDADDTVDAAPPAPAVRAQS